MVAKGKEKRKPNAWILHVKETMKFEKVNFTEALKLAGKTWKKGKKVVTDVGKNVGKTVEGVAKKTRKTLKTKLHVGGKKTKTKTQNVKPKNAKPKPKNQNQNPKT